MCRETGRRVYHQGVGSKPALSDSGFSAAFKTRVGDPRNFLNEKDNFSNSSHENGASSLFQRKKATVPFFEKNFVDHFPII
jgi:hypothetical protein